VDGEAQIYVRILKKVRCLKRDDCHMVVEASSYHKTICRDEAGNTLCSSNEDHCLFYQTAMCMEGIAIWRFVCSDCSQIAHTIKPSFRLAEAAVSGLILLEPYTTMETAPEIVTKHVGFANLMKAPGTKVCQPDSLKLSCFIEHHTCSFKSRKQ